MNSTVTWKMEWGGTKVGILVRSGEDLTRSSGSREEGGGEEGQIER